MNRQRLKRSSWVWLLVLILLMTLACRGSARRIDRLTNDDPVVVPADLQPSDQSVDELLDQTDETAVSPTSDPVGDELEQLLNELFELNEQADDLEDGLEFTE